MLRAREFDVLQFLEFPIQTKPKVRNSLSRLPHEGKRMHGGGDGGGGGGGS